MKQLKNVTMTVLDALNKGEWATYGAKVSNFSLAEGEYVGLPTAAESWRLAKFTVEEYETVKAAVKDGTIAVSNNTEALPTVSANTTVNEIA